MRSLIHQLRTRLAPGDSSADEHLLGAFLAARDPDAFAALVRRHGPMVRGVCRRVLGNAADADDAYQAVWLVLLRKADAVRPRSRVGNFLYGVAVNVARRARDASARRRAHALTADVPERAGTESNTELREVLDRELSALPDAYRAAVVACDLEGHTRAEAAGRLGWSEGTVASRLARGRALLADRLTRRGLTLPAAGLAVALGADACPARSIPMALTPSPAAEGLAKEVTRAMLTKKLRAAAAALLAAVGVGGAGAATVWACGGLPRLAPPVSANKPFPLESVESREPRIGEVAAWARPTVSAPADVGAEKPAGPDAGAAKTARFVLTNPAGDVTVVSDRHEPFAAFFRRQPVMVAGLKPALREKLLSGKPSDGFEFVDAASFNQDGPRVAAYGASVKLAALPPGGPVYRMLGPLSEAEPLIFVQDAADKHLWHAVGWTRRPSLGFFAATARAGTDDFAPADLIHTPEKK